jgi:LysR family transcriptional activator of nhaA
MNLSQLRKAFMNLNNINFNHLYYFYVIANENSLSGATKVLNVSQPTLSQQLKQFEEFMGAELFNRSSRSLELNENGRFVQAYATEIFEHSRRMLTSFSYRQKLSLEEQFRIGVTTSTSKSYASKLLTPLFEDQKIGVSVVESSMDDLIQKLHSFELDFILGEEPQKYLQTKGTEVQVIKKPQHYFVCGKKFDHHVNNIPEDLNSVPYFKYTALYGLQKELDIFFSEHDVLPSVVGETDDIGLMLSATEVNHCFCVVPDLAANELIKTGRLRVLGEFETEASKVCAIFLKEHKNESVQSTIETIKRSFQ